MTEPSLTTPSKLSIPQLAFGLYKVPADESGVSIILEAIKVSITNTICKTSDIDLSLMLSYLMLYLSRPDIDILIQQHTTAMSIYLERH